LSLCNQLGSDLAVVALDVMKNCVDPMMLEMIDGIDTDDRLSLRPAVCRS
jgi:hypothetical protein